MNLVSKSQGKEPCRQLHLTKKPKQLASQSFQLSVCDEVYNELDKFFKAYGWLLLYWQKYVTKFCWLKTW